jgi:diacylglycerol kinase family enzyme
MASRDARIEVIATAVSGSIADWSKVQRIEPLFREAGWTGVRLSATEGHRDARARAAELVRDGARIVISAGGSGTFNAVLAGILDAQPPLAEIRLGFLRKGSADLIGKVLGMPDAVEAAVRVFSTAIERDQTEPCDLLRVDAPGTGLPVKHFVGYGGAGLFGRIPHFTENRFMKWYKGVLSQVFGDLGPFTTGMSLALTEQLLRAPFTPRRAWRLTVDGAEAASGRFQALILVNGYLGPQLAYSEDALGSGRFHCYALRDRGGFALLRQAAAARSGAIRRDPARWGMEHHAATRSLEIACDRPFPLNVDGSTLLCRETVRIERVGAIPLLSARSPASGATRAGA